MENDVIIDVDHVSMRFNLASEKFDILGFKRCIISGEKG